MRNKTIIDTVTKLTTALESLTLQQEEINRHILNTREDIDTLITIINITTVDLEERTDVITGSRYYIGDVTLKL